MEDITIPAPLLAVLIPMISFLVMRLLQAKDAQIASEREDKLAYRDLILKNLGTTSRLAQAADKATAALAKEKGIIDE